MTNISWNEPSEQTVREMIEESIEYARDCIGFNPPAFIDWKANKRKYATPDEVRRLFYTPAKVEQE